MNRGLQIYLNQLIIWIIALSIDAVLKFLFIDAFTEFPNFTMDISLSMSLGYSMGTAVFMSLILGTTDLFLEKYQKKKHSFAYLVLTKSLIYVVTIIVVLLIATLISVLSFDKRAATHQEQLMVMRFVGKFVLSLFVFSVMVSVVISFLGQVNKMIGHGNVLPMFLGKYHSPKVENRIFMFLDLKSSTTLAEKLGHLKYSELIQDSFHDLNLLIPKYRAEIYQYVGDEAVVTWKYKNGIKDLNCLRFFFDFVDVIKSKSDYYIAKYETLPAFKAGVNSGKVTVTEVGNIKREIAYHGDVLNTAARIQSLCNSTGKKLLISENLKSIAGDFNELTIGDIGNVKLKGKTEKVRVFSVEQ